MSNSLSMCIQVCAGVVPGVTIDEYSRTFAYTSEDKERDRNAPDGAETNTFTEQLKAAHNYAMVISDPRFVNWVKTEFIWL